MLFVAPYEEKEMTKLLKGKYAGCSACVHVRACMWHMSEKTRLHTCLLTPPPPPLSLFFLIRHANSENQHDRI